MSFATLVLVSNYKQIKKFQVNDMHK